jgi:hypothetical protein
MNHRAKRPPRVLAKSKPTSARASRETAAQALRNQRLEQSTPVDNTGAEWLASLRKSRAN